MAIMLSSIALALGPIFRLPGGVLSDLDLFTVLEVTPTIGFHYGAISSCISASLKCILPSHFCIVQAQCINGNVTFRETLGERNLDSQGTKPRYHNKETMCNNHAFVRLTKPYKSLCKPRGAIEYAIRAISNETDTGMWKNVLVPNISKLCWYPQPLKAKYRKNVLVPPCSILLFHFYKFLCSFL